MESLFSIRHENGAVEFFEALSPAVFAKVVYIKEGELVPIDNASPLEKFVSCAGRRKKVFVTNCLRALRRLTRRFHSRYRLCGAGGRLIAGL